MFLKLLRKYFHYRSTNAIIIKGRKKDNTFLNEKVKKPTPVNIAEMSSNDSFVQLHSLMHRITHYSA